MKTVAGFALPMSDAGRKVLRTLKVELKLVAEAKERARWTVLDTFDWRLLSAGFVLLRDRKSCELHRGDGDECIAACALPLSEKHTFIGDFPVGPLQARIADALSIRAALPRAEFIREIERHRVLNSDGKTTVRLELETLIRPVSGHKPMPFQRIIRVVPLKGYEREASDVSVVIKKFGLAEHTDTRHYVFAALEASGVEPFDYTSKIKLEISPEQTAREACTQIHLSSWRQMQINVPGMMADIDSEFLHDFRVALRRTRSLLQLVKGVHPQRDVARFKKELGDVMRSTNRLRDLDVYLLEQDAYAALLPPNLRPGLEIFFRDLARERTQVYQQFKQDFQSASVKRKLKAWESFLSRRANKPSAECPDGEAPVDVLARRLLRKRFNRIIKDGRKITDRTPDDAVHELRIQFKKLRYLLEFFRSLFDGRELDFLIKRSRKMQNVLGDFNDVCVQQQTITNFLTRIDLKRPESVQLCAALGALVAELERKRHAIRKRFNNAFRTLDDAKALATADHLFHVSSDSAERANESGEQLNPTKATDSKTTTTRRRPSKKSAQ